MTSVDFMMVDNDMCRSRLDLVMTSIFMCFNYIRLEIFEINTSIVVLWVAIENTFVKK